MRVRLTGPFQVWDDTGQNITPPGMKERGLLALVLASPGQRRTRAWLQDKLWSDRNPQQGAASLRQALSNIRKALGSAGDQLQADRTTIWLSPEVAPDLSFESDFLDDIDIRDPEFSEWLRDQRSLRMDNVVSIRTARAAPVPTLLQPQTRRPIIELRHTGHETDNRALFVVRAVAQRLAGELILAGDMDVILHDPDTIQPPDPAALCLIELESLNEGPQGHILVRLVGLPLRRVVWSGRMSLEMTFGAIWSAPDVSRCINAVMAKVTDLLATQTPPTPHAALHRSVRRIYEYDPSALIRADDTLKTVQDGELRGLALAWRSFVRLTSALEFRDLAPDTVAESRALADDALRAMPDHPVILALASQARLKLEGDLGHAHYLALRAAEVADQNPYALEALSQTLILHGDYDAAHRFAERARIAAQGMAHSFNWDMQSCLSALSLGRLDDALEAATACHRKMPFYRPALRYLVALSLILGNRADANHYAARLQRLEPDFTVNSLLDPDYPLETLRALGHVETLKDILS